MHHFCTYFDIHYLTRGLALYDSLCAHSREPFRLWILCMDEETHSALVRLDLEAVNLISRAEFEANDPQLAALCAERDRVAFYWTSTPSLPLHVLGLDETIQCITYLDADLFFFRDPGVVFEELGAGSILIGEHRYSAEFSGWLETSGRYNVGLLSFRRDANGLQALRWWRNACLSWRPGQDGKERFSDQVFLDDWPRRFGGVVVLQQKGAGLAPWNISGRRLASGPDGVTVDDEPVVYFHFHALKLVKRHVIRPSGPYYHRILQPKHIETLFFPYGAALARADRRRARDGVHVSPVPPGDEGQRSILAGLLEQGYCLTRPRWLGLGLWTVAGWHQGRRRHALEWRRAAFAAHGTGDRRSALRWLAASLRWDPTLIFSWPFVSVLFQCLGGRPIARAYRALRACGPRVRCPEVSNEKREPSG